MVPEHDFNARLEACKKEVDSRLANMENVFELAQEILASSNDVRSQVHELSLSFSSYVAKAEDALRGFPDADPDGHRRVHEALIEQTKLRAEFYRKLRDELAKWGILGLAGFLFMAAWLYLKNEMHK